MAETIKFIGNMIARKLGGAFENYHYTDLHNLTLVRATLGSNQTSVADATGTRVNLDTEVFDIGNNFASYKYVCLVAGYYHVDFGVHGFVATAHNLLGFFASADNGSLTELLRGSRIFGAGTAIPQNAIVGSVGSGDIYRTAGQEIGLMVYADMDDAAATFTVEGALGTFLNVHLVST